MDADTAATMSDVCRALDGLPLAIELAERPAPRRCRSTRSPRRLDDRFAVLSDPTGGAPTASRALEAAISWSYELLFPDDQRGLWALACFTDGAPLPAVEHAWERSTFRTTTRRST